jgi:aminoglycoside phosphotransferase (APT) family kinase protein
LADLGYVGIYWTDPGQAMLRHNDPSGHPGSCTFDHLVQRYATRTGRDVSNVGYYKAFSSFRLAVISEGVYARYLHGAMGDQDIDLEPMKLGTETLAEAALAALTGK